MLDTRLLASRTKRMNFFVLSHLVCGVDHEAPGKVLLCLVQLLEAAGAPWPAAASPQCLHHPRVHITPMSASPLCLHHHPMFTLSPPCPHHHPGVHITPVSAPPPCLNHPGVCIITPVSASPPWCLYHASVHITPVSTSPLCLHHPGVHIIPMSASIPHATPTQASLCPLILYAGYQELGFGPTLNMEDLIFS